MKKIISSFKDVVKDVMTDIYSLQINKYLTKKQYSKIPLSLDTYSKYINV